jgi:2-dehydropantoate 2-reductase
MRYVIIGIGAIGGTLAAALHRAGRDVLGVGRGAHLDAVQTHGLLLRMPGRAHRVALSAVVLDDLTINAGDVVVVATKSQHTEALLMRLADVAPASTPIICAQNGVTNEPAALRWFESVYGAVVNCPALHLVPGEVAAYSCPTIGVVDVGRWPGGEDATSKAVATDLDSAGFSSQPLPDISRWKYAKLLNNLGNAVEVVCRPRTRDGELTTRLKDEARDVLHRHGIDVASDAEYAARLGDMLQIGNIDGPRPGGSTWQSVTRGLRATEADYLNGEIVRLGRLRGLRVPANALMQQLTRDVAQGLTPVGGVSEHEVLARL